jgi:hypothetical protein
MGEKRKHTSAFQVGPANLPDGTRKRKADRIKDALIKRAKIKQDFEKVKKRKLQREEEEEGNEVPKRDVYEHTEPEAAAPEPEEQPVVAPGPHPDRQALMNRTSPQPSEESENYNEFYDEYHNNRKRGRKFKQDPYTKQAFVAGKQREEADQRRQVREGNERQRERKIKERESMQRMMKKAKRPTVDGKMKLGRESGVLLEKVKRMMKG